MAEKNLVLPGLEPGTFRVWSERDNHYTTELMIPEERTRNMLSKVVFFFQKWIVVISNTERLQSNTVP